MREALTAALRRLRRFDEHPLGLAALLLFVALGLGLLVVSVAVGNGETMARLEAPISTMTIGELLGLAFMVALLSGRK